MSSDDRPLSPLPSIDPGTYRHYKGGFYEVLGLARHSETLEPLVLYRPIAGDGTPWVRPWSMFCGEVEINGVAKPRFVRLTA